MIKSSKSSAAVGPEANRTRSRDEARETAGRPVDGGSARDLALLLDHRFGALLTGLFATAHSPVHAPMLLSEISY